MNLSLIVAHPDRDSFNHAISRTVYKALLENGHTVFYHDLYEEGFDPLLYHPEFPKNADLPAEIHRHCDEISSADGIIIIHPNWWGQPPAILKGWIDRVIRPGVAYEFLDGDSGEGTPIGLLKAKAGLVFNTSNTMPQREREVFGDPLERLWKDCIFGLCGVNTVIRRMYTVVVTSSEGQRQTWLEESERLVNKIFPSEITATLNS
jgi:putative NADPH-quinone reductase